jgi:hypothetical protein
VRAFVAQNLDQESDPFMSVDGEGFKWDTIHVEVLPRAGTILSLDGRFFHTRFVHKDHDRGK